MRYLLLLLVGLGCILPRLKAEDADLAKRVVVVANADDPDSMRIARYYAAHRNIPAANIIALSMPAKETISWREFVLGIWQPLQDELVRRQWIDGIPMSLFDSVGRRKMAFSGHRISYLVVCRGVPLRIENDPALLSEAPGVPNRVELKTNRSAVDSELSLLAYGEYNINALVPNPLFQKTEPMSLVEGLIVKVSRLDGPTADGVIAMIDGTLEAEAHGLIGRAYVDVKGPYAQGDGWMEDISKQLTALDFAPEVNRQPGTFPVEARFDAPALYFGWYAPNLNGPFTQPGFRFAPGAIAIHIHSTSAQTLRSTTSGWCGPLLARGAAVTTGAVYEPYLQWMHYPHLLLAALVRGETLGDAAYYALPALSWQDVLIGDPLYRPFKRNLAEQWARRTEVPRRLACYLTVREMRHLVGEGKLDAAIKLGRKEQHDQPSLVLGVALADLLLGKGDKDGAARALGFAPHLTAVQSNEWTVLVAAADMLMRAGKASAALQVYENLFARRDLPDNLRLVWLREAVKAANTDHDMSRCIRWEQEAARLSVSQ